MKILQDYKTIENQYVHTVLGNSTHSRPTHVVAGRTRDLGRMNSMILTNQPQHKPQTLP